MEATRFTEMSTDFQCFIPVDTIIDVSLFAALTENSKRKKTVDASPSFEFSTGTTIIHTTEDRNKSIVIEFNERAN
jgi:hypothetical protein